MASLLDFIKLNPPEDDRSYRLYLENALRAISKSINLLNNAVGPTVTVAQLPAASAAYLGRTATVTDGQPGLALGAAVIGGANTKYLVWCNGAAWTVMGT